MIQHDGYTLISYVDLQGKHWITELNNTTRVLTHKFLANLYTFDDHNRGSAKILPDGRLIVGYAGHNNANHIHIRIGTTARIASLGNQVDLDMGNVTSYPQFILPGGDRLLLSCRVNNTTWALREFTPSTNTWGSTQIVLGTDNVQYYNLPRQPDANTIRVLCTRNVVLSDHALRAYDIDLSDGPGMVLTDGVERGYIDGTAAGGGATLPMAEADMPIIYQPPAGRRIRLYDHRPAGGAILIDEFDGDTGENAVRKFGLLTGANHHAAADWTWYEFMADAGDAFYLTGRYRGGPRFANDPHTGYRVYNSWKIDGVSVLEQCDSADGVNWTRRTLRSASNGDHLARPVSPVGAVAEVAVIYQRIKSYTNYNNMDCAIHLAAAV